MFGRGGRRSGERIEPRLDDAPRRRGGGDLRADPADRPGSRGRGGRGGRSERAARRPRRSFLGRLVYWGFVLCLWGGVAIAGLFAYYASQLPPIDQLAVPKRPPNIAILADDGSLIANRGDTGGAAVHLSELPPYLPKAFVAIEDRRFYSHFGIDPIGVARAVFRDVTGRGGMEGGSTLTQQLAKNLFLTQERTLSRKIQEAILALWLERKYSKDQILELYLNRVYFGSGAFGVEAAAQKYFGKSARQVTLSEAAVLAGLMKSPTRLAPNHNLTAANERAAQVITAMAEQGHITEAMAKLALASPAQVVHDKSAGSINYAADYVMDMLDDTVGAIDEDIVVTTTLDPRMQAAAEHALTDELNAKGDKFGVEQGALVALDPDGAVKALVGGRNYADSQFNRAVAAKRQPGSTFKPFVYLAALEKGLTPDTVRDDAPISVKGWKPENYSREYFGPVTLTRALALSLNTVAVRLGLEVGPKTVARVAHRLGVTSELDPNATIALGTSAVTPLEMVAAYDAFANGGIGVQPHVIARVRTANGKLLYARKNANFGRVIDPQYVAMMNSMMEETLLTGTARKAELPGWQAAGKTGTSQDWRDAWFVGYTSALTAGVWLGNDDNSPTKKTSGGNLPVEIWSRFMKAALEGVPPAQLPSGVWRNVDTPVADAPPPAPPAAGRRAAGDRPAGAERRPRRRRRSLRRVARSRPPPTMARRCRPPPFPTSAPTLPRRVRRATETSSRNCSAAPERRRVAWPTGQSRRRNPTNAHEWVSKGRIGFSGALRQSALDAPEDADYLRRRAARSSSMSRNLQIRSRLASGRQGLAAKFPPGRRGGSDAGAGAGRGAPPLSVARPLYARPDERREILRRAAAARRDDGRRHGRRSRRLREPALQAGRFRRRHGRLAALRAERRARPQQGRREGDSAAGLSRPARHARRHGVVGPQQDHRAQGGRDGRWSPRRPARSARWSASSPSSPARGRSASPAARRNASMRPTSSATTPASTTSRRASPRS